MVGRGRPRNFDRDTALCAAMKTFWKLGYEGASMAALTEAMGINSPSLYAAFGCKEALFREAVQLYLKTEDSNSRAILESEPTARAGFAAMLRKTVGNLSRPGAPHGCLVMLSDNVGPDNESVHQYLCQRRRDIQVALEARLKRGVADGDIPAGTAVKAMAAFYMTVVRGLSSQARDGASRETMLQIAHSAMAAWDSLTAPRAGRKAG